jgi:ATP/maltotriose-dependent transcriptional regulator MalT
VLHAPAGYGKTTLAAEWLQGRPEEEVAWYYAGPASADVAALSVGIAEAVSHILPAGDRVRQRLRVPQVPDNAAEILAELLAHDLMAWPDNAWLVLDDYHQAMESKSAERFVEELVRLAPLRILITTRRRPTWVTARRVIYGEVTEFTQEQLSMTRVEATQVLTEHGSGAGVDERVTRETWPALIGLAVLTSATQPESHDLETTLYRYLAEEVLSQAPRSEQTFMLRAALLPYLNAPILSVLSGDASTSIASALRERGLLRPDGHGRLRFHPLLNEFLRKRASLDDPEGANAAAFAAFSVYVASEDWDAAFQVAIDAKRFDLATSVLERAGPTLLRAGRLETLDGWLRVLDEKGQLDSAVLLLRAEIALRKGTFSRSAAYARFALESLTPDDPRVPATWNLLGRALHMRCDHLAALAAYENGHKTSYALEDRLQAAWGRLIATIELGCDDPTERVKELEAIASPSPDHRLRLACGKMMAAERSGARLPLKAHREALSLVHHASDPMAISHAYATGIYAHSRRGAYREALRLAPAAVDYCAALRLTFPLAYCLAYRANAEIGLRRLRAARLTLAEVARQLDSIEDAHLRLVYETLQVKLAIATGSSSYPALSASSEFANTDDVPEWPLADLIAVEALAFAGRGESERVLERKQRLRSLSRGQTADVTLALADLVIRIRTESPGETPTRALGRTLRWLVGLQCLDSFVTAYRAWPELIRVALVDPSLTRLVQTAVLASNDWRLVEGTRIAPTQSSPLSVLTRREKEVASLMAAGLTNAEISAQLFIARSTTKVHVRRVVKKLRAKTRLEAALVWRDAQPPLTQR